MVRHKRSAAARQRSWSSTDDSGIIGCSPDFQLPRSRQLYIPFIDIRGYRNSRDVSGSHATRHCPMQETPIHLAARLVSLISESDSNS
jgi:hypothetical protein